MKTRNVKLTVGVYFLLIVTVALILGSCKSSRHANCDAYGENSILNPDNAEFIEEVAFNAGVKPKKVTQIMFNQRYSQ